MYNWNENPDDDPWTEYTPRQEMGHRLVLNPSVIAVIAAFILLAVLSTMSFGYFSLGWFNPNRSSAIAQAPTATATQTNQPTATTGLTLTATATPRPTATPKSKPTATPTPAPGQLPTLWANRRVLQPKYCTPTDNTYNFWVCGLILEDIGSVNLKWKASSTMSKATFNPPSGVLTPNVQVQVLMTLPCVLSGTVYYTGPANQIVFSWGCTANQPLPTPTPTH